MAQEKVETLVIDNFEGSMSYHLFGNINSGLSWVQSVSGQNPFVKPSQLTWAERPEQIDSGGSVITDLIVAGKERVESGILYVYCVGHTGRVYKIQVNDPTTYNPDYDNPTLLATISSGTPTFTKGGFIDFFGATERIYIGHDKGVTRINFDGTTETVVGVAGSWTQSVPRPLKQFVGKLYVGNGSNIAEIDSTATVASYAKLSPGFPTNSEVRDLDLTPDGNYLEIVSSSLPLYTITSITQETSSTSNASSYIFKWNGTDTGYTSQVTFPSFSVGANTMFQNYQYTFGTDQYGTAIFNPTEKLYSIPEGPVPLPNAITSNGNLLLWAMPIYYNGVLEMDLFSIGSFVVDTGNQYSFRDLMFLNATAPETDIIRIPLLLPVSNAGLGASSNGYANNLFGTSKMYFSTLESSSGPTTAYRFYKWKLNAVSPASLPSASPIEGGFYQTQNQMFEKRAKISEVRIYGEPWVADNVFTIDLMGTDGLAITNGSKTFTAGSNLTIGSDFAKYSPACAPQYCVGVGITTSGDANFTINKIEIDYSFGGN